MFIKKTIILFLAINIQIFSLSNDLIKKRIDEALTKLPPNTKIAILIFDPLTQDTIYLMNHTASMIPASNTKIFTTATALSIMGGNYPLATKILTDDKNITNGIINGNLYIKGYGNSLFTGQDLDDLVQSLKSQGIKKISGYIIGDDTFFDDLYSRSDWISDETANIKLPPISALVIDRNRTIVQRRVRVRKKRHTSYQNVTAFKDISDPPLYLAQLLREKLIDNGIVVGKTAMKGETPSKAVILTESKILLKDIIKIINKRSDNFLAECLFKTLGAIASGRQGNSFYSTQAVLNFLKDNNIYSEGTSVVDGSGISRYDFVTVGAIVGVLEKMYFDLKNYQDFYNSLSIAGVDGTLRNRMQSSSAENEFHGKTGTLNGVSSLSGYLKTGKGEDLIISMIFDFDKKGARYYRGIENDIVEILTNWE
ncbi:MAG: D-alanyl-D-alanine carboxypeptidase/D-alanyl-D-alanine-endopeptidase [Ignavibacteriaceae bacterium]|jgi:D-alanyl-D-alanine carboxypeptidase